MLSGALEARPVRRSAPRRNRRAAAWLIASPSATRPCSATTQGATRQPSARNAGSMPASTGAACVCTAPARQTVGDDERDVMIGAGVRGQRCFAFRRQPAAEVRTHQMALPVLGRAGSLQHRVLPSAAISATSRGLSSGSCTASRARACASLKSSNGVVASDAPVRARPMRAAVSLRSAAHGPCSAGAAGGCGADLCGLYVMPAAAPGKRAGQFARPDAAGRIRHATRQRVMERALGPGKSSAPGTTHHEVDTGRGEQRQQRVHVVLIGLGVVGVADVDAHRQAQQLAAEMVFQAGAGDLLAVVEIFRPDETDHGVDQQRLVAPRDRVGARLQRLLVDAVMRAWPRARCPARFRNTSRCRPMVPRRERQARRRAPRRAAARSMPKLRLAASRPGNRLEHKIDRRAPADQIERGRDMRQHAALRRDFELDPDFIEHRQQLMHALRAVGGRVDADHGVAARRAAGRRGCWRRCRADRRSDGWAAAAPTAGRASPSVLRKRVTTEHFAATTIRSCSRLILLTAAAISGVMPGASVASTVAWSPRPTTASRGSRRRSDARPA